MEKTAAGRPEDPDEEADGRPGWPGIALLVAFGLGRLAMGLLAPGFGLHTDDPTIRWTGLAADLAVGFEALVLAVVAWRPPRRQTAGGRAAVAGTAAFVASVAVGSFLVWARYAGTEQHADSTAWSSHIFTVVLAITMSITLFPLSGWRPGRPVGV